MILLRVFDSGGRPLGCDMRGGRNNEFTRYEVPGCFVVNVESHWDIPKSESESVSIPRKQGQILDNIRRARADRAHEFFLTWSNAVQWTARGTSDLINPWLAQFLAGSPAAHAGVVIVDYVDSPRNLVPAIIRCNRTLRTRWASAAELSAAISGRDFLRTRNDAGPYWESRNGAMIRGSPIQLWEHASRAVAERQWRLTQKQSRDGVDQFRISNPKGVTVGVEQAGGRGYLRTVTAWEDGQKFFVRLASHNGGSDTGRMLSLHLAESPGFCVVSEGFSEGNGSLLCTWPMAELPLADLARITWAACRS